MMSKTIEEILAAKPEARPRIYAYSISDAAHRGLLKVGQTTRDVKRRIAEQLKTAAIKNFRIELDERADRDEEHDGHRDKRGAGAQGDSVHIASSLFMRSWIGGWVSKRWSKKAGASFRGFAM